MVKDQIAGKPRTVQAAQERYVQTDEFEYSVYDLEDDLDRILTQDAHVREYNEAVEESQGGILATFDRIWRQEIEKKVKEATDRRLIRLDEVELLDSGHIAEIPVGVSETPYNHTFSATVKITAGMEVLEEIYCVETTSECVDISFGRRTYHDAVITSLKYEDQYPVIEIEATELTVEKEQEPEMVEIEDMKFLFRSPSPESTQRVLDNNDGFDNRAYALCSLVIRRPTLTEEKWFGMSLSSKLKMWNRVSRYVDESNSRQDGSGDTTPTPETGNTGLQRNKWQ